MRASPSPNDRRRRRPGPPFAPRESGSALAGPGAHDPADAQETLAVLRGAREDLAELLARLSGPSSSGRSDRPPEEPR